MMRAFAQARGVLWRLFGSAHPCGGVEKGVSELMDFKRTVIGGAIHM